MATGPIEQLIEGNGRIPYPYLFIGHRTNDFIKGFPNNLPDNSGVYVFANLRHQNTMGYIVPKVLYVGKTKSFHDRVTEDHEKWNDAEKLDVTDVCLLDVTSEDERLAIERDIYDKHDPPLNDRRP